MSELGRRPDYRIMALNKDNHEERETDVIGAAWDETDGRISIKFNRFLDLSQFNTQNGNFAISLFRNRDISRDQRPVSEGPPQPRERHPRGSRRGR